MSTAELWKYKYKRDVKNHISFLVHLTGLEPARV